MPAKKAKAPNKPKASFVGRPKSKGPSKAFDKLLKWCDQLNPKSTAYSLLDEASELATLSDGVQDAIASFHAQISPLPFVGVTLSWAHEVGAHVAFGERYISCIADLLESHILPSIDAKSHKFLSLGALNLEDHAAIFDAIRSNKNWPVDKQEEYTSIYNQFANWLAEVTYGLTLGPFDTDRSLTSQRRLPFDVYVKILKWLSDREKILAKIFYLGGSRSLEEVLSLKIADIDYKNNALKLSEDSITYPKHVLLDLKDYIGSRSKGYVFIGRTGDKIDHTVPYRALKTVTSKLDLDPAFTFKDFVTNV